MQQVLLVSLLAVIASDAYDTFIAFVVDECGGIGLQEEGGSIDSLMPFSPGPVALKAFVMRRVAVAAVEHVNCPSHGLLKEHIDIQ